MHGRVCPWWIGYLLASPLRRFAHDPRAILAPVVGEGMIVVEPGPGMGFFTVLPDQISQFMLGEVIDQLGSRFGQVGSKTHVEGSFLQKREGTSPDKRWISMYQLHLDWAS